VNKILIAVAVLATSTVGLVAVEHYGSEKPRKIAASPVVIEPVKSLEAPIDGAYSDYQKAVKKEQSDPAKKAKWAADAEDFKAPSGHCPTEKECE
jgi:DNA-binding protein YbaB